jgi:hypothetical protein
MGSSTCGRAAAGAALGAATKRATGAIEEAAEKAALLGRSATEGCTAPVAVLELREFHCCVLFG